MMLEVRIPPFPLMMLKRRNTNERRCLPALIILEISIGNVTTLMGVYLGGCDSILQDAVELNKSNS